MATNNAWNSSNPVEIAKGGTNATSMATSTGIVKYDGTRLVTSSTALIDSSNRMTNTSQPAFAAFMNTGVTNVTGDGTTYTVVWDSESFDQGGNFSSTTFTAPISGLYRYEVLIGLAGVTALHTALLVQLTVAGFSWQVIRCNPGTIQDGGGFLNLCGTALISTTSGQGVVIHVTVSGSTKTIGLTGVIGAELFNWFSGSLVC